MIIEAIRLSPWASRVFRNLSLQLRSDSPITGLGDREAVPLTQFGSLKAKLISNSRTINLLDKLSQNILAVKVSIIKSVATSETLRLCVENMSQNSPT